MSSKISTRPALLTAQIRQMLHGLNEYTESFVPASPTKTEMESVLTDLEAKLQLQINAAGKAESATQTLYETRDRANFTARRMRDAIYAFFGKHDARIVEFGLDTLKSRKSVVTETETGTEAATTP
ncbi:hypothetical protein KJ762_06335 [bacterium]|nr:hypothetical protein [bacterium]MBU1064361.1 hypothetical protein [bacterium]MBU1634113.1 hypothetical protein [bacterium]MBU1873605.1 hypothetical protein [bacterium]